MDNKYIFGRLGFSDTDLDERELSFSSEKFLSKKEKKRVFYYGKGKTEQVKTRFYWVETNGMSTEDIKAIHERIWNENKADLLILETANSIDIKYVSTSPKEDLLNIVNIPKNIEDSALLNKISKEHITTGAFWIEYSDALERIKRQHKTVDQALVESLSILRKRLEEIYSMTVVDKTSSGRIVQALIDRTLFIKFLEDKKIINSVFYQKYFGDKNIHYKNLLLKQNAKFVNELFCRINEVFKNKLFETPEIREQDLLATAMTAIAHTIDGTTQNGQLSLFDFQFDIIPIEFISHIYQIFLDDKKAKQGIFYTPEGLAKLLLENVITDTGTILDPSCGSGIFLVLAFRNMYKAPNVEMSTYDKIQHRLNFIKDHIFGIEIENTAARLAVFSLYLEVLNGITAEDLNTLITSIIRDENGKSLFSIDFSDNIQEKNALIEGKGSPFYGKHFKYIVGNPPWFLIKKGNLDVDYKNNDFYWNKYKLFFSKERQISQCFLHRIIAWSSKETRFGFIVNSSNFINESDNFQKFILSTYKIEKIFELYHIREILFDYATEPACLLVFNRNNSIKGAIEYYLPKLNSFAKTFRTILLNTSDAITIKQEDLQEGKIRLRDFLIGNQNEISLADKIEKNTIPIEKIMLKDRRPSFRGFEDWGSDALKKEFGKDKSTLSDEEYKRYEETFRNRYYSNSRDTNHPIPFLKSAQISRFRIEKVSSYCRENISSFHRPRASHIYEGEKILCSRIGDEICTLLSNSKLYFGSDVYSIKLQKTELYNVINCCLNSDLINFFSQVKLRKRIGGSLSRLDSPDLKRLPVPKRFDKNIIEKLDILSRNITNGIYSFEEKRKEMNNLVFDLYDMNYIERQRISDFFIRNINTEITMKMFEDYCITFLKTIKRVIKTGIVKIEYTYNLKTPFDIAGVRITFGNKPTELPTIDKVQLSINYEMLKRVGNSLLISLKERIYTEDSIFIIKDRNPQNWTKSAAYDDATIEICKLLQK
ncbi:N-6 DNA methylase [Xylanibacter oryzae]|nr:N-6 DNA methylase [Xylanibacter oryzae]